MKYLIVICLLLTGCATLQNPALETTIRNDIASRVAHFNTFRGVSMPIPDVIFISGSDYGMEVDAQSPIAINSAMCEADMDDCLNDTVPHELAHWAMDYYGGYHRRLNIIQNPHPGRAPIVNKTLIENAHGEIWCDTMRTFGGVPEKHGYCH